MAGKKAIKQVILKSRRKVHEVKGSPGQTVTWTSKDSDFRIWFPPEHDPLEPGPDKSTKGNLTRKLKRNLVPGEEYEYSMFFFDDQLLAEGNSPPIMIIQ